MKSLNVAIVGTRGIPNRYGGFERLAEELSVGLASRGHAVTVYNPHYYAGESPHPRVRIVRRFCPESLVGAAAHYVYDWLSFRSAVRRGHDVVVQCGYASSTLGIRLTRRRRTLVVTNMDGLEWQRAKWSLLVRMLTRFAERDAVRISDALVADNAGIAHYLRERYETESTIIEYGTHSPQCFDESALDAFGLVAGEYFLCVARLEPENNVHMVLQGHRYADSKFPVVVVGGLNTRHARILQRHYTEGSNVRFVGPIYDQRVLDALRHFCKRYFHGHSVGGTNPALLEAMAAEAPIAVHENPYNRSTVGPEAPGFADAAAVRDLIDSADSDRDQARLLGRKLRHQAESRYSWGRIVAEYESLFNELCGTASHVAPNGHSCRTRLSRPAR